MRGSHPPTPGSLGQWQRSVTRHSTQSHCKHMAACSTHAAAASQNSGANLGMMAVHAPIVLIPALPNSARHDVLRRGTRCTPWLLHVLEGVLVVVARAGRMMINGNHAGIKPNPKSTMPGTTASEFATRPCFASSPHRHTSHHQWPEDPSVRQERAVGHQVFVNLRAKRRHRRCSEPVNV